MILWLLVVVETLVLGALGYAVYNLYNKNETLEKWISAFANHVEYTYQQMKMVDDSGIFEADDDVGFAFEELRDLIFHLRQIVVYEESEEDEESSEEELVDINRRI